MMAPLLAAFGPLARAVLTRLDAETAHHLAVAALARLPEPAAPAADPLLGLRVFGRDFPNPLGLAAGFDKNADVGEKLCALGFGFAEVGGVTPLPQPGNARPRVFRLSEDGAIINRYGLNSAGMAAVAARLAARRGVHRLGVNLGPNKDSADRVADFVALVGTLGPFADFVTINVSSPNTPGLRDLQGAAALDTLVARVLEARPAGLGGDAPVPVLLKIAPDLDLPGLDSITRIALSRGVDGLIIANTTMGRPASLRSPARAETGGLSGRPVFALSTWVLAQAALRLEGRVPLVGVGGIDGPEAALAKIDAGASLVQLYSALVFEGPGVVGRILAGLRAAALAEGGSLAPRVGRRARDIAALGPEAGL